VSILSLHKLLRSVALVLCLLTGRAIAAQPVTFNAPIGYQLDGYVGPLVSADLNGDGHPDLVVGLRPGRIAVLLGTGGETFHPPLIYTLGLEPNGMAIGDFNGDGKPDLAVSMMSGVAIMLGNGDGTFQPPVMYAAGADPSSMAIGDFNGDGKLDLAVQDFGSNANPGIAVSVLLGHGDGTFHLTAAYPVGNGPSGQVGIAVADFNGDGKADLVLNDGYAGISILLGNGNGTFQPPTAVVVGSNTFPPAVADFNGDGIPDLAVPWSTGYTSYLAILLGKGDGTFQPPASTYCGDVGCEGPPTVADFNGDGIPDVAGASGNGGYFVMLGAGGGAFQPPVFYPGPMGGGVVAADFNGDGHLDLAAAGGDVFVLLGNGAGAFKQAAHYPLPNSSLAVGDFNGDGKPDVAVAYANGPNATISILLNGSDRRIILNAPNCYMLAVGDFNTDGKLDLAVVNEYGDTVSIYLGNGDGTFQTPLTYAVGNTPYSLVVADFNGDGKPDLAVANFASGTVSILLGNGDGTLRPQTTYAVGTNPIWIAAADFNGDGKMDLTTANGGSGSISILLGKGDGTFLPQTAIPMSPLPTSVAAGDFNGDGYPDLVVTNGGPFAYPQVAPQTTYGIYYTFVTVLLGNGDGTFQPQVRYPTVLEAFSVAVADFNGDGNLDLAVGNIDASTVSILLGNGDGTFARQAVDWFTGYGIFPLLVADLNGDGKPDLVTGGPAVMVLTNTTP
jgi:hypothetical protein